MKNIIKRTTTALFILGICSFALTSVALVASANGGGGDFDAWLATPGGQIISQGAVNGQPGHVKAFKKVYEALCGVELNDGCHALCGPTQVGGCFEWSVVYSDGLCPCGD